MKISQISQPILLICKILLLLLLVICLVSCVICVSCFISLWCVKICISQVCSQVPPQPVSKSEFINRPSKCCHVVNRRPHLLTGLPTGLLTGRTSNDIPHIRLDCTSDKNHHNRSRMAVIHNNTQGLKVLDQEVITRIRFARSARSLEIRFARSAGLLSTTGKDRANIPVGTIFASHRASTIIIHSTARPPWRASPSHPRITSTIPTPQS